MEKEEFLRLLPKLIREDDEVKGAIITALSGVVATKDDIQRVIEHSDKRFEALQQETDKRFKAFQEELDKRFEIVDERISKNQEILISHSKSLEFIMKNMPNIQNLKDIDARMKRLENLSATQYKTLDGKIDTKFNELNEKLDVQGNDIKDIKKMLMDKH
ncbi:MAG: hypothetical protein EU544_03550 [Promethearchaeota archaeon]|nr:MAG: hypothetical protein EU544_03550 [Candidatus Lokiarchaeota archaeon]